MIFRQSPDGHYYIVGPLTGLGKMITYQVTQDGSAALLKVGIRIGDRVPDAAVHYMRSAGLIYTHGTGLSGFTGKGRKEWEDEVVFRISQLMAHEGSEAYVKAGAPWGGIDLWDADLEGLWAKYGYYEYCISMPTYKSAKYETSGNDLIFDVHTGLTWQTGSSKKKMNWYSGVSFVHDLNIKKAGDHSDWRMPTLQELATLLKPSLDEYCPYLSDAFQQQTYWCWSCDVFGPSTAWRVNFLKTWAEAVPKTDPYSFVKAVRGSLRGHAAS
ncbi:MAG TPA: hypothetical protein DCM41_03895 [Synergistaceae bacterium]|nr:hypothetical protein [Synergistaceae bacterium]